MRKITVRMTREQIADLDGLVARGRFPNRSEAVRNAVNDLLDEEYVDLAQQARDTVQADGGEDIEYPWGDY